MQEPIRRTGWARVFLLGGCIALALGMYALGDAIRDAGERIATGTENGRTQVVQNAGADRYRVERPTRLLPDRSARLSGSST